MPSSYLKSLLGAQEKILLVTRQHWSILVGSILLEIVLILVILGVATAAVIFLSPLLGPLAPLLPITYLLLVLPAITLTRDVLDWLNHQYIVTNRRVIQILGVFDKRVTDSALEKVNDVTMEQSLFGRLFGYGDIEILTASETGIDKFRRIGDPIRLKIAMLNAKEGLENWEDGGKGEKSAEDIPSLLQNLDQLRQSGILTEEEFQLKKADLLKKL